MRGVSFLWNDDVNYHTKTDIGFVAQELQHVMPELVFKAKDSEEALYHVKYHDVIALCLEAIKEQSLLLDSKEEKLEKLEIMAKEKGLF
jgi:predicted RNase H-like HicB family nuclease